MAARELLLALREAGVSLRLDDGRLIASPTSAITPAIRTVLTAHRDALIREIADPDPRVTCATCRHARGEWCAARGRSGLPAGYIGGIQSLPQNCPAWQASAEALVSILADEAAELRQCSEEAA